MHIHVVFFWLWKTTPDEDRQAFRRGLDQLTSDPNVRNRRIGTPAATRRSVIDTTYDYGLTLEFDSLGAHQAYQDGAPHQQFLRNHAKKWSKVQVYDIGES